ncbi:glycosyltransferase [Flavobacteriaceae bacterium AU392]|nr:glycosyltransferase [Flavobacteriaceae bacterium]RKM84864.1 glycosyltransferase [Flavobacteriaceae bacterium AU392]
MSSKKKVIIFLHEIQHYRVPVFRIITDVFELTLVTDRKDQIDLYKNEPFITRYIPINKIGPFIIHKQNIHRIASNFDIAIGLMNLRCIDIMLLPFNLFLKTKIIYWGIGVSASYTKNFDANNNLDFLRFYLFNRANALIFYTSYPIKKYVNRNIKREKLFIANNTVEVFQTKNIIEDKKKNFLFIGSLYPQKGINELLEAYLSAYRKVGNSLNKLIIVGKGSEYRRIEKFIVENKLTNQIYLEGAIYDQKKLKKYFLESILCISPKQAGLSVLMSMGYSLCFLTNKNAITGGEILNITHDQTGLIYHDQEELVSYLIEAHNNPKRFIVIGRSAKNYYDTERKPKQMANGIIDALKYVIK